MKVEKSGVRQVSSFVVSRLCSLPLSLFATTQIVCLATGAVELTLAGVS